MGCGEQAGGESGGASERSTYEMAIDITSETSRLTKALAPSERHGLVEQMNWASDVSPMFRGRIT